MHQFSANVSRTPRLLSSRLLYLSQTRTRRSSGSPITGNVTPEEFTKTGKKEQDPAKIHSRSYEYSQSGGDEMVAAQQSASFDGKDTNPATQKTTAGKGNVVNPLEFSPASVELSEKVEETVTSRNEERGADQRTGQGVSKKAKIVKKTKLDFK